ncbi:MAG: right-handed parallel beta-helix repeat-containing protein [Solirubrobacterales bacterium]|nr:right-handed parallel beta-helix repeat-containing protein [Solirubrobacterales bacterium]
MSRLSPLPALLSAAAVAAALAVAPAAAGAVPERIWVAPRGADAGPGTKARPLATLHEAQRRARRALRSRPAAGVQVILRGGVHRLGAPLRLTAADSGRPGARTVYRAQPGERPVISGAAAVPGSSWRPFRAGIWRARVGDVATRELYVNGRRAVRAATGDYPAGFRPAWNGGGDASGIEYLPTVAPEGLNPAAWGDPAAWRRPADVEAVILTQWKMMTVPVESVTPPAGSAPGLLRMVEPAWTNANLFRDADGEPGIWSFWQVTRLENALEFLDEPGEWYVDRGSGWLYYMPRPWERMRAARVELPVLEALVRGGGTARRPLRHVDFRGLTFRHATWLAPSGSDGYVADQSGFRLVGSGNEPNVIGHVREPTATPGNVSVRFGRDVRFVGNRFRQLGAVGLALGTGSQRNVVRANSFVDVGSAAITLSGIATADHHPRLPGQRSVANRIAGNLVARAGRGYPDAAGIFVGFSSGTRVIANTIQDVPWSGIAVGWGWGLLDPGGFPGLPGATPGMWGDWTTPTESGGGLIARNTIRRFLGQLWDGGAIYTTGAQGTSADDGLRIVGNTAYGKRPGAGGNTFYTDGGSRYVTVSGNSSYSNPIGATDFGPPPRAGDPLPYPAAPSLGDGLPYGSDSGGCVTYGDISYVDNRWQQPPMAVQMALANIEYALISAGGLVPYSPEGYFSVCPYESGGVSYPTNLRYAGNETYPLAP